MAAAAAAQWVAAHLGKLRNSMQAAGWDLQHLYLDSSRCRAEWGRDGHRHDE